MDDHSSQRRTSDSSFQMISTSSYHTTSSLPEHQEYVPLSFPKAAQHSISSNTLPTEATSGSSSISPRTKRTSAGSNNDDYYLQGSQELATETALTLQRLEARRALTKNCERLVLVLVGLPARGKSFLGRKLTGFLNWHGIPAQVFNVGKYRRQVVEGSGNSENNGGDADFFDANNHQAAMLREQAAELALLDMLKWLDNEHDEDEYDDDDDDDDDMNSSSRRAFSQMNPECLKSERYTRHDFLSSEEMKSIPLQFSRSGGENVYANQHRQKGKAKRQERVAIFDATNSTDKRREWILDMCTNPLRRPDKPTGCVFIESICDDEEMLLENLKDKIANSPDYDGMDPGEAMLDIQARVQKYEAQYETISNDRLSYIKVYNLSTKMMVNHIYGRMSKIIMPAMMAWNIGTRPIFLCRPGQTMTSIKTDGEDYVAAVNMDGKNHILDMSRGSQQQFLRGYHLGEAGKEFSQALLDFCEAEGMRFLNMQANIRDHADGSMLSLSDSLTGDYFPLQIYTSTMPRASETIRWDTPFDLDVEEVSNLNPLDKGDFAGKELGDIRTLSPSFYQQLVQNPFNTRFPGGESYCDLTKRLDPVIVDLEQQVVPTLVVSHVSVLQMLVAYFRNSPVEECMDIDIPLHTVIKFTPARGGGWSESIHPLANGPSQSPKADISLENPSAPSFERERITEAGELNPTPLVSPAVPGKKKQSMWRKIFGVPPETSPYQSSLDERLHNGHPAQSLPSH